MDLISHTLTGVAVGTVAAAFSNKKVRQKLFIIFIGGLGGALPDFDAISLWSKFDGSVGWLFGLKHTGHDIYFGKFWYSHHGAMHSLLALIFILCFFTGIIWLRKKCCSKHEILYFFRKYKFEYLCFALGFTFHLLEDMPTPTCVWGGVNLFFPSSSYIGGWGKIWWWNNYDIFLIIIGVIFLNLWVNFIPFKTFYIKKYLTSGVFCIGLIWGVIQINTRPVDFNYYGHNVDYNKLEHESKQIQKEILGPRLYSIMESLDNGIPLYF